MINILSYFLSKLSVSNIISIALCVAVGILAAVSHGKDNKIIALKAHQEELAASLNSANTMLLQCSRATEELQRKAKEIAEHKKKKEQEAAKIRSSGQQEANQIMQDQIGTSCQESIQYGITKLPKISEEWNKI